MTDKEIEKFEKDTDSYIKAAKRIRKHHAKLFAILPQSEEICDLQKTPTSLTIKDIEAL